jgi:hypothetical protein
MWLALLVQRTLAVAVVVELSVVALMQAVAVL